MKHPRHGGDTHRVMSRRELHRAVSGGGADDPGVRADRDRMTQRPDVY